VIKRNFWLFEANHQYYLMYDNWLRFKGALGIDYRHGEETILLMHTFPNESIWYTYFLKDFGLSVAFEAEIALFWHIYASGQVEYTRFVYTYSKGPPGYKHFDGPSKNMLSFQLGLGYRF
jgi:hypothetical protein